MPRNCSGWTRWSRQVTWRNLVTNYHLTKGKPTNYHSFRPWNKRSSGELFGGNMSFGILSMYCVSSRLCSVAANSPVSL